MTQPFNLGWRGVLIMAIVLQVAYEIVVFAHEDHGFSLWLRLVFTIALIVLALNQSRWVVRIVRALIGLDFGLAVCDRFGLFGPYGSPGVSWGDFGHFIAYTQTVNAFLPAAFAPALATIATVFEVVLAGTLIPGIASRWACRGAALLLLAYTVAMSFSLAVTSSLAYAVPELCAGAWFLSTLE